MPFRTPLRPPHPHAVQFYDNDAYLTEVVVRFLGDGLTRGEPLVVVATQRHRDAFTARLESNGFDIGHACRTGRVTLTDARTALSTFMVGPLPDRDLFNKSIGHLVSAGAGGNGKPAVYGEMVDLLWREGNADAAIRLEELWNELISAHPVSLLCAYSMSSFYKESHKHQLEAMCRQHTHVMPAESYPQTGADQARLRAITVLQQRAQVLEAEIAHGKTLERELKESLAERERLLALEQGARAEAETASRLKDEFLAVLSHELRTPLNAILGWTQIVDGPRGDKTTMRRAIDVIRRNATLQMHLIDDLLDVSRIMTGKMQIDADAVDLVAVATAAMDTVRPAAGAKDIDLDLQADTSARVVTGDAGRLQQVIWNLLSNAIKFTPRHGHVGLQIVRVASDARIVVRDTGQRPSRLSPLTSSWLTSGCPSGTDTS